jgi:ribosomal protein S18 acetylase RimI-like enzyme
METHTHIKQLPWRPRPYRSAEDIAAMEALLAAGIVGTHHDNHAAFRIYESVGFQLWRLMLTYETANLENM